MHVNFPNRFNALQCQLRKHVGFNAPQEHVFFHLFHVLLAIHSEFVVAFVHNSNSQHELLRVVVVEDAIEIVTESSVDLFGNLFHRQFLVSHSLSVKLDTEQPWRDLCGVKIGHFVINVYEFLILGNDYKLK